MSKRSFSYATMRLLPKAAAVRPIINLRKPTPLVNDPRCGSLVAF